MASKSARTCVLWSAQTSQAAHAHNQLHVCRRAVLWLACQTATLLHPMLVIRHKMLPTALGMIPGSSSVTVWLVSQRHRLSIAAGALVQIEHGVERCPQHFLVRMVVVSEVEAVMVKAGCHGLQVNDLPAALPRNIPSNSVQVHDMGVLAYAPVGIDTGCIAAVLELGWRCCAKDPQCLGCLPLLTSHMKLLIRFENAIPCRARQKWPKEPSKRPIIMGSTCKPAENPEREHMLLVSLSKAPLSRITRTRRKQYHNIPMKPILQLIGCESSQLDFDQVKCLPDSTRAALSVASSGTQASATN